MDTVRRKNTGWSLNFGEIRGIPIRIHLTFFLLLMWVALDEFQGKGDPLMGVAFVCALFACVLLHELGHALVARFFGIQTRDIVLYIFGGVATLLGEAAAGPELLIALAGPLVNVVIALMISPFIDFRVEVLLDDSAPLLVQLFRANIMLVLFNLIPAFPMDGGRVVRAAMKLMGVPRATLISSRLSQVITVVLGLFAIYAGLPLLLLVSIIIFTNASQEHFYEKTRTAVQGQLAKDVMTEAEHLVMFTHGTTLTTALNVAIKSFQTYFPVTYAGEILGLLEKEELLNAAALDGENNYISSIMIRDYPVVSPSESLASCLQKIEESGGAPLVVKDGDKFLGMIFREKLVEYLIVRDFRKRARDHDEAPDELSF